jgi:hypothetical protein
MYEWYLFLGSLVSYLFHREWVLSSHLNHSCLKMFAMTVGCWLGIHIQKALETPGDVRIEAILKPNSSTSQSRILKLQEENASLKEQLRAKEIAPLIQSKI